MVRSETPVQRFSWLELHEALEFAADGNIALHYAGEHRVPGQKGKVRVAHLFDQCAPRLRKIARECGVKRVKVENLGLRTQHIDLWGKPLSEALERFDMQTLQGQYVEKLGSGKSIRGECPKTLPEGDEGE